MTSHKFTLKGETLVALPSGALFMPAFHLLCVSDLHLGKSERIARRRGLMLPPYENRITLEKLDEDLAATQAKVVICLGDSFDDMEAADALPDDIQGWLSAMQAGREWIWIAGNHDAGPVALGGSHVAHVHFGNLVFRHIATAALAEVSGHYHPKHRVMGAGPARPCFLYDSSRLIMPAYGAYTGGLSALHSELRSLLSAQAIAVLTGKQALPVPLTS